MITRWTIKRKITVTVGEDREIVSESPYSIDPDQTPKHITMEIRDIEEETRLGIYEMDGATLRLSFTIGGGPRPKSWSQENLMVLKRIEEL